MSVAGHPAPLHWRAQSRDFARLPDIAGLPLGLDAGASYGIANLHLRPGDLLLMYTDGIIEAVNSLGAMFGSYRLRQVVSARAGSSASEITKTVILAVEAFMQQTSAQDDYSLLAVRRCLPPGLPVG